MPCDHKLQRRTVTSTDFSPCCRSAGWLCWSGPDPEGVGWVRVCWLTQLQSPDRSAGVRLLQEVTDADCWSLFHAVSHPPADNRASSQGTTVLRSERSMQARKAFRNQAQNWRMGHFCSILLANVNHKAAQIQMRKIDSTSGRDGLQSHAEKAMNKWRGRELESLFFS